MEELEAPARQPPLSHTLVSLSPRPPGPPPPRRGFPPFDPEGASRPETIHPSFYLPNRRCGHGRPSLCAKGPGRNPRHRPVSTRGRRREHSLVGCLFRYGRWPLRGSPSAHFSGGCLMQVRIDSTSGKGDGGWNYNKKGNPQFWRLFCYVSLKPSRPHDTDEPGRQTGERERERDMLYIYITGCCVVCRPKQTSR